MADAKVMLALSIRQPYAELILRGEKTIEYRSRRTKLIGQRFYIYASQKWAIGNGHPRKSAIAVPALADLERWPGADCRVSALHTGVIVGSAVISSCTAENGHYCWHLSDVRRYKRPRKVKRQPQPVWFVPW
ncbi:MAG: ASCH domain-containing protein [Phycisphaerales bacterium]